jgi:CrcB protein
MAAAYLESILPPLLVGVGGALGALGRFAVTRYVPAETLPMGTLAVNVLGSFLLGLVTFAGAGENLLLFVGVGACGSFTTFSSFSFETVRLYERGHPWRAALNAVGTLLGAGLAVGLAWLLASG